MPNLYLSRWHGCLCEVDDDMMLGYILSLTYNHRNHSHLTQNRVIKIECDSHHTTQAPNLWFLYLIYDGLFHLVFRFRLLLLFLFLFRSIFLFQRCNLIHIHWGLNSTLQEIKTEYVNKPRKIIWTMKTNTHVAC